jgi:hypothetical protein
MQGDGDGWIVEVQGKAFAIKGYKFHAVVSIKGIAEWERSLHA